MKNPTNQPGRSTLPQPGMNVPVRQQRRRRHPFRTMLIILVILFLFFTPWRTTVLVLGIDRAPEGTDAGRSDTMILGTMPSFLPKMTLLSIPRDLWVPIPGVGENRINTAHYFAELNQPGTGMQAAANTIETDFGIRVPYVLRIRFDGIVQVVDAMGGIDINVTEATKMFEVGQYHMDGTQALAFVRDRSGGDDFSRQKHGQIFISSAIKTMFNPLKWVRIPAISAALASSIDSNIPLWVWPRVLYGTAFSAVLGFDTVTLDRAWVTPWVTDQGAQVLLPNWALINPAIQQIFK